MIAPDAVALCGSSSPPPPSTVVEKDVLLYAAGDSQKERGSGWYVVRATSSGCCGGDFQKKRTKLEEATRVVADAKSLSPLADSEPHIFSSFNRIGTKVYRLGGCGGGVHGSGYTTVAYVADMAASLGVGKWERMAAEMLTARQNPETLVVDGKLFVFGGTFPGRQCTTTPWGEFYDPASRVWTGIAPPPSQLYTIGLFAAYDPESFKTKIVLGSTAPNLLLAYDFVDDVWETISDQFYSFTDATRPVLHDSSLYWVANGVGVYDLRLKTMFRGPIKGYFDQSLLHWPADLAYEPVVFHLTGDEFCCIWSTVYNNDGGRRMVCCSTIRISNILDNDGGISYVEGRTLLTRSYVINQPNRYLSGMLL